MLAATPMSRRRSYPFALLAACACTFAAAEASAQPTAWAYVGGGALAWQGGNRDELELDPTLVIDAGIGSEPLGPFILGGVYRFQPVFGEGIDMSLAARVATTGFQSSYFGVALDLGGYARFWGPTSGGFYGQAVLGGPLGFQLSFQGMVGGNDTFGFGGSAGIDFVRLAISRDYLQQWWPNPRPYNPDTPKTTARKKVPWWL